MGEALAAGHADSTQPSQAPTSPAKVPTGRWSPSDQLLVADTRPSTPSYNIQAGSMTISHSREPPSLWDVIITPARPDLGASSTVRVIIMPSDAGRTGLTTSHPAGRDAAVATPRTSQGSCFMPAIASLAKQLCFTSCGFSDPVQELPTPHLTSQILSGVASALPPTRANFANYNWSIPHEALRHECMRLECAAAVMSGTDASFARFKQYFETYVVPFLERHHAVEEALLTHYLLANKVAVPTAYADDHLALKAACAAVTTACQSKDLSLLKVAVRCFGGFLRQHMADEESNLLPKISAAFAVPWINDLITHGSPRAASHSPQSWSNTLQLTTAATSVKMAFEASKKWGAAKTYRAQLPRSMQDALLAPQQEDFVRRKEVLLVQACRA